MVVSRFFRWILPQDILRLPESLSFYRTEKSHDKSDTSK
jgi:hypothetical protein